MCAKIEEADILPEKMELAISGIELALSGTSEPSVSTPRGTQGSGHDVPSSDAGTTESRRSATTTERVSPSQNVAANVVETPAATSTSTSNDHAVTTRST